ncbi:MAG: hypothetical protein P8075_03655 [Deltaproteobacteria bacterium]
MQLFYMMGYCRRYNVQVTAQISHTGAHAGFSIKATNGSWHATSDKMEEHPKAVRV